MSDRIEQPARRLEQVRRRRAGSGIAALLVIVALLASSCVFDGSWALTTPIDPTPENPSDAPAFRDVSCPTADFCMAIGSNGDLPYSNGDQLIVEVWDGATWAVEDGPPLPAGTTLVWPGQVSCGTPTSCGVIWGAAVGGSSFTFLARWDGTTWSPAPQSGTTASGGAVGCAPDGTCVFARGSAGTTVWDGLAFETVAGRVPDEIRDLSCVSASYCMGVTRESGAERWDGDRWEEFRPSHAGPYGYAGWMSVSCTSTTDCLAVGLYEEEDDDEGIVPIASRWNGASWIETPLPLPRSGVEGSVGGTLATVSCAGPSECVAMGSELNRPEGIGSRRVVLGWNGTQWIAAPPAPQPAGASYLAISCSPDRRCMAVGSTGAAGTFGPLAATYEWAPGPPA